MESTLISRKSNGSTGLPTPQFGMIHEDADEPEADGHSGDMSTTLLSTISSVTDASRGSFRSVRSFRSKSSLRNFPRQSELKLMDRSSILRENTKLVDELTINKYNMEAVGLIGREREIEILKSRFEAMIAADDGKGRTPEADSSSDPSSPSIVQSCARKELIFIKGNSGVGKSSLAQTLKKHVEAQPNGIFVTGKFDLNGADVPYSGIAKAFGEICKKTKDLAQECRSKVGATVSEALDGEVETIFRLVPELNDVVSNTNAASTLVDVTDIEHGHERVKNAFRTLTRALSSQFSPMVIVLDDLQWADVTCLEAIDFLISDMQNANSLMVIGCYRSNEADENSLIFNKFRTLEEKKAKYGFNITEVELESCQLEDVNKIIMAMMSIDDGEKTRALAEICFKRTLGNPYFLTEFMIMLQDEGLISYNLGALKWIWDEKKIADATMSTANVVELLQARIRRLPERVQLMLQYAACLGSSFRISTLELIWHKHKVINTDDYSYSVEEVIAAVSQASFVESCGDQQYRFVHDKVQEALLSRDAETNATFQFQIGTALYYSLDDTELENALFDIADLINKGNKLKRQEFAALNLRAAEKARNISAFHSAAKYAAHGITLLPTAEKWASHRSLSLRLYTVAAEAELALGHIGKAETYSNEVLGRSDCSPLETLPLKMAKARKLCTVDLKFKETIDYTLELLKALGCKLVWNRGTAQVQAIATLLKTIKIAKKAPDPSMIVERLGVMTEPRHQATMNLLARLCYACYNAEDVFLNVLGICKSVEMTLKYGVNDVASVGFAGLGLLVVAVQQDFRTAKAFAEMALAIQKTGRRPRQAETIYVAHSYSLPWTKPLQSLSIPFAEAYKAAMQMGETDFAMWSLLANHVWVPYTSGKALGPILKACPKILSQMEEVSQPQQALILKMFWQMMLNLTSSSSSDLHELEGKVFSSKSFDGQSAVLKATIHLVQGELLIFTDFEMAAERAIEGADKFEQLAPAIFLIMIETFHRAVALYALARRTKKRKYKVHANKLAKRIEKWMKSGNPNVKYYYLLLSAEKAALNKKFEEAEENYKNAIVLAARTGHMHHAALCNERYADFLLEEKDDELEAKYRVSEAIRFYEAWGAVGKVERMKTNL
eukprot:scaffold20794_cov117-Cylindrotheca_fusiformis.AAC.3